MGEIAMVALAGAVGALGRWQLSRLAGGRPWGTLAANLAGCVALGVVATAPVADVLAVVVGAGLLGGLTTFSTFALEAVRLGRRAGTAYVLLSVVAGVALVAAGAAAGQQL